ncbi:MAG: G8 domain-containing protein, partial [Planctomycetota bacterium]
MSTGPKNSSFSRIFHRGRRDDRRSRQRRQRRRLLLQGLEKRQLLAGDMMPSDDAPAMVAMMGMHHDDSSSGDMGHMNHAGHSAAMNLVPLEQATHVAASGGDWSDPSIWEGEVVPAEGAHVVIPEGIQVTVDGVLTPEFKTIRVDGTLNFATDRDTELRVDTLVSSTTGHLVIGTETNPIQDGSTARVVFADDGSIDRTWDPSLLSRGALLHGQTTVHGSAKTSFVSLASPSGSNAPQAVEGSDQITLSAIPDGWAIGDTITIAGVDPTDPASDEVVTIREIDGVTITLDRELARDHVAPREDLQVHVANLTRNVVFASENTDAQRRAHIMFVHTNDVDVRYAAFEGLGRTDKSIDLEDWRLVSGSEESVGPERTEVEDLGGFNVRGRYSVHFHRGGTTGEPGLVQGSVVRDDPGWAYVNHSSNVDFVENVSHNITGSAYNTEAGDEVGSFVRNIAIRTVNPEGNPNPVDVEVDPEQEPDARVATQDFGWQGDGFWFHGPGVTVEDNVVSGASGHAFIYWSLGLVEKGLGENLVDVANLPNRELIGPEGTRVRPKQVPVPSFDGNTAYNVPRGLNIYYLHTDNRDDNDAEFVGEGILAEVPQAYEDALQSTFSNFTAWNVPLSGVVAPYAGRLTFDNIRLIGTGGEGSVGIKLDHFANQNNFTVRNVQVEGYDVGIAAPRQGDAVIENAQIAARTDIRINVPDQNARDLRIRDVEFLPLTDSFDDGDPRVHIDLNAAFDLGLSGGLFGIEEEFFDEPMLLEVPSIFQKDRITLDIPGYENVGLYFDAQSPDFVPVPRGSELSRYVPDEIVDLTNAQLQDRFEFSVSDAVTPEDAMTDPLVQGGVVGPATEPFANFPPERDTYWVNFLAALDDNDDDFEPDEDEEIVDDELDSEEDLDHEECELDPEGEADEDEDLDDDEMDGDDIDEDQDAEEGEGGDADGEMDEDLGDDTEDEGKVGDEDEDSESDGEEPEDEDDVIDEDQDAEDGEDADADDGMDEDLGDDTEEEGEVGDEDEDSESDGEEPDDEDDLIDDEMDGDDIDEDQDAEEGEDGDADDDMDEDLGDDTEEEGEVGDEDEDSESDGEEPDDEMDEDLDDDNEDEDLDDGEMDGDEIDEGQDAEEDEGGDVDDEMDDDVGDETEEEFIDDEMEMDDVEDEGDVEDEADESDFDED